MVLPIVILFERHWDIIPKLALQEIVPALESEGYTNLCMEATQDMQSEQIIAASRVALEERLQIEGEVKYWLTYNRVAVDIDKLSLMSFKSLVNLMQDYVSKNHFLTIAEKVKELPAVKILSSILQKVEALSMTVVGIDLPTEEYCEMHSLLDGGERWRRMAPKESYRERVLFENILKLRANQDEGMIVLMGALHAPGMMAQFEEQGMQNEVVYCFPHSPYRYGSSIDDVNEIIMCPALQGRTHLLIEEEVPLFSKNIVDQVRSKITYQREIPDSNSHAQFLSDRFKARFRPFVRPGYCVDLLVDREETANIKQIEHSMKQVNVETRDIRLEGREFLVIPRVNMQPNAEKIRQIPIL